MTILILVFAFLHIYSVDLKVPIQKNTNLDLKEQLVTSDQISWIVYAQLYTIWGIQIMRNVANGLVLDDSAADHGAESIMELAWGTYNGSYTFLYGPDESVDQKLRNLKFPNLFNYDGWVSTEADMHFYDTVSVNPMKVEWRVEKLARQPAQKIMHNFLIGYPNRNFSKPGDFIPIPLGGNSSKDPQEEFIRLNYLGDLNK